MPSERELDAIRHPNRPSTNAFYQQRLHECRPILRAGNASLAFLIFGVVFVPIGIVVLRNSNDVVEKIIDYTDCTGHSENITKSDKKRCSEVLKNDTSGTCVCHINFTLENDLRGEVFMYYGLTNFYQNHRMYVKSRDDYQLLGYLNHDPFPNCEPFDYVKTKDNNNKVKKIKIVPCGIMANSLFNDELFLYSNILQEDVPLIRTGISWPDDKVRRFRNPLTYGGDLSKVFQDYASPTRWRRPIYELDTENPNNNGFMNEDLIVWLQIAALPSFRKLYRIVNNSHYSYSEGLPAGNYTLRVNYIYPVASFKGRKCVILSTTSVFGGKNPFLGTAFITVGTICLTLTLLLLCVHIKYGKRRVAVVHLRPACVV